MAENVGGNTEKPRPKDWWDRLAAISIGTILVAAVGGWYTFQQSNLAQHAREQELSLAQQARQQELSLAQQARQQELYTQMLAQREKADSELRTGMFRILIDGYFNDASTGARKSGSNGRSACGGVEHDCRIMFLELLARNFDTIDIAPLFKDLDRQLTGPIRNEGSRSAFRQRERLRKTARSLASHQVSAMASLEGTRIEKVVVRKCLDLAPQVTAENGSAVKVIGVTDMQDGQMTLRLDAPSAPISPQDRPASTKDPPEFTVSFFDMPYIDNSRLPSGQRLAVVMRSYFSPSYGKFVNEIEDPVLRQDYQEFLAKGERCDQVSLRFVLFPDKYLGLRDRPYLEEVLTRVRESPLDTRH